MVGALGYGLALGYFFFDAVVKGDVVTCSPKTSLYLEVDFFITGLSVNYYIGILSLIDGYLIVPFDTLLQDYGIHIEFSEIDLIDAQRWHIEGKLKGCDCIIEPYIELTIALSGSFLHEHS